MKINERLQRLLQEMEEAIKDIEKIKERVQNEDELFGDFLILRTTRDASFVAIQSAIDISNRIISIQGFRKPESYRDAFEILIENKVLKKRLGEKLKDLVGLRNTLIHLYWRLERERLYRFLKEGYKTIIEFKYKIGKYLEF